MTGTLSQSDVTYLRQILGNNYSVEADRGFFYLEVARIYRDLESWLQNHPDG